MATSFSFSGIGDVNEVVLALGVGTLGAVCALPVALSFQRGSFRLDHPSTIMAFVLAFYWLAGLLTRSPAPDPVCARIREYLGPAAFVGALAAVAFFIGAGLPPAEDGRERAEPEITSRGLTAWWILFALLWIARVFEVRSGIYFTHSRSTADLGALSTSSIVQVAEALRLAPCVLTVVLWRKHRALALAALASDFTYVLFSGCRIFIIQMGAMLAIGASLHGKRIPLAGIAVAGAIFIGLVNPLVVDLRHAVDFDDASPADVVMSLGSLAQSDSATDLDDSLRRSSTSGYFSE
jgi:hypothetical protein